MGRLRTAFNLAILTATVLLPFQVAAAQGNALPEERVIRFDEKVHDFGDVLISDGPLKWTFTFENVSSSPIVVHNVISSCGCTTPEWTKEPVRPDAKGRIDVTFANDQGAYPFDKTLTAYVSGLDKPVILRIRGYVHDKRMKLADIYPEHLGNLAFRSPKLTIGYVDQGLTKSDRVTVANISGKPITVRPVGTDRGLSVSLDKNPIPAHGTAQMTLTVDTKALNPEKWGKQNFCTGFTVDGKKTSRKITVSTFIKDNFNELSNAQIQRAGSLVADESYYDFGEAGAGTKVSAIFHIRNVGAEPLVIHKIEADCRGVQFVGRCPVTIRSGAETTLKLKFDTTNFSGETTVVLTLVTNSPSKPLINLFLTGTVTK